LSDLSFHCSYTVCDICSHEVIGSKEASRQGKQLLRAYGRILGERRETARLLERWEPWKPHSQTARGSSP
jgi:hypothetical protein